MKVKKPSLGGTKNCGYLGHFAKDKYMAEGHNTSLKVKLADLQKAYENAPMASEHYYERLARQKSADEDRAEYERKKANSKALEQYSEEADKRLMLRKKLKEDMMD